MFTGIIEQMGTVREIVPAGTNKTFWIESPLSGELNVDQSVAHNGVCLTVEEASEGLHRVTAIAETLKKTDLDNWKKNTVVNLERCLSLSGCLDGHLVQGHVDTLATCTAVEDKNGSKEYQFSFDAAFAGLLIEKGSITVNGISLTLFDLSGNSFRVAIIPYTLEHTNIQFIKAGDLVNLEFDMVGKYVNRFMQLR